MYWAIPRLWSGATVAVLASGPSMSQAVADQVRAAGVPAIAVNNTFRLAPWASMLYAADANWWQCNPDALGFDGLRVSAEKVSGVLLLRHTGAVGFEPDPSAVRTGGNSGYQAVHVAAHAGAKRILLCGFDMHDRGGSHWHGDHPHPLRNTGPALFERWCQRFEEMAGALSDRGIEVLNCTPGSALKAFPQVPLVVALQPVHDAADRVERDAQQGDGRAVVLAADADHHAEQQQQHAGELNELQGLSVRHSREYA